MKHFKKGTMWNEILTVIISSNATSSSFMITRNHKKTEYLKQSSDIFRVALTVFN